MFFNIVTEGNIEIFKYAYIVYIHGLIFTHFSLLCQLRGSRIDILVAMSTHSTQILVSNIILQ